MLDLGRPDSSAAACASDRSFRRTQACARYGRDCSRALVCRSISGCAVGPNFNPRAVPDVNGYVPGKLASPNPGPAGLALPPSTSSPVPTFPRAGGRRSNPRRSMNSIKQSVEHNPSLQAAEAAIKVAQYNALAQRGLFFPQVTGNSTSSNHLFSNRRPACSRRRSESVPQSAILAGDPPALGVVRAGYLGRQFPRRREAWMRWRNSSCFSSRPPISR